MPTCLFKSKSIHKLLIRFISLLLLTGLACNTVTQLPEALQPTATPTPTLVPTSTSTPTPTFTPTPVTTGSLQGKLVEGVLSDDTKLRPRPPLENVLVILCADYREATQSCTTRAELMGYTDADGAFAFDGLEPGTYAVLYNPFKIEDGAEYLAHYEGREIVLADVSKFVDSILDGETNVSISGGPNAGVSVTFDQSGNLILGAPTADTAIYTSDFSIVAEYVGDGIPATVEIELGQTANLSLEIHATLMMGDTMQLEPAGEPIQLPDARGVRPPESADNLPKPTQSAATQAPSESAGLPVLEDSFDDNHNGWTLTSETVSWGTIDTKIAKGRLVTTGTLNSSMYYNFFPDMAPVSDCEVSLEVRNVSGVPATEYGLVFYAEDDYSNMTFAISDSGTFSVMSSYDGINVYAVDEPTGAINPGATNTLTVKTDGKQVSFYINGKQVYEVDAPELPAEGLAGVYVDWEGAATVPQTVEFDNFRLTTP